MYQRRFRLVARIARVCIETGKAWEAFAGRSDDAEGSTSILNTRRMHRTNKPPEYPQQYGVCDP